MDSYNATLQSPFSMILAGPSGCGKTWFICKLIEHADKLIDKPIDKIIIYSGTQNDDFDLLKKKCPKTVEVHYDVLPKTVSEINPDPKRHVLLVLDDLLFELAKHNQLLQNLFVKGIRHHGITALYSTQNLFFSGTQDKTTLFRNSNYIVLFRSVLDLTPQKLVASRLTDAETKLTDVHALIQYALTNYRYLLLDAKSSVRFRTHLFGDYQICFTKNDQQENSETQPCAEAERIPALVS